jgi:hypothetical protein
VGKQQRFKLLTTNYFLVFCTKAKDAVLGSVEEGQKEQQQELATDTQSDTKSAEQSSAVSVCILIVGFITVTAKYREQIN